MNNLKKQIESIVDVYKSGRIDEAESLARELLKKNPKIAYLYNLIGLILTDKNKIEEALSSYEQGIQADPMFGIIYNNIGLIYFKYKEKNSLNYKKAEEYYKKSISIEKNLPEPHNNLANLYKAKGKFDEAIVSYKKALDINSQFSYAHFNLANTYVTIGKFDEASKHFRESINITPKFFNAHRGLSRIIQYHKNDEHLQQLKEISKDSNIKDVDLFFALGKAYSDTAEYEKSFKFYQKANHLHRSRINFSIEDENEKFDRIKSIYNKNLFKKYKDSGYKKASPIFILGMPRSGTTLVEQILSSHPDVFGADEQEFIPELIKKHFQNKDISLYLDNVVDFQMEQLTTIGKDYISMMDEISKKHPRTTDKLPTNFLSIGLIKLILPNSKIVNCKRNPKDNCLSIYKNHFTSGRVPFAYDIDETVNFYNLYIDLMNYWNQQLPGFIYNIEYENLVQDTRKQISDLLKFTGLKWNDNCIDFYKNKRPIRTASDVQARSKIYDKSIDSWKMYESNLKKYFDKLNS
tara:strand:+ start:121 stop:1683 length:1563 start_codon:yes stop_codon:yes gene_type:complete